LQETGHRSNSLRAGNPFGMDRELELERETNLATGWAREILRSADRMETLDVDPKWAGAITRYSDGASHHNRAVACCGTSYTPNCPAHPSDLAVPPRHSGWHDDTSTTITVPGRRWAAAA
jgi:hypothetical protein